MTCCTPFSPASAAAVASPTRHVNYATGMVLGVDDYRAEFDYHAARTKWIMRECAGYGTLAGLAVSVEADGANGPRLRVGAGSAVAPSGQFICIGGDQCGSLNAWLARPDIAPRVTAQANAALPGDTARLSVWLMLGYVDCAVAPVPIPGQPCRSEDSLMAPSRVADDYLLTLSLDPPLMTEARALGLIESYAASWDMTGSGTGESARKALRKGLSLQLDALFGASPPAVSASDLAPLTFDPALRPFALSELRRLWITRVRPQVMAQRCADGMGAEDAVLLARIDLPVLKAGSHWEVGDGASPAEDAVGLDEQERPWVVAGALAASTLGAAADREAPPGVYSVMSAAGTLDGATAMAAIRLAGTGAIALTKGTGSGQQGRVWLRNCGPQAIRLKVSSSGLIDGQAERELPSGAAALLVADGLGNWLRAAGGWA